MEVDYFLGQFKFAKLKDAEYIMNPPSFFKKTLQKKETEFSGTKDFIYLKAVTYMWRQRNVANRTNQDEIR